jgi:hypothetical protein
LISRTCCQEKYQSDLTYVVVGDAHRQSIEKLLSIINSSILKINRCQTPRYYLDSKKIQNNSYGVVLKNKNDPIALYNDDYMQECAIFPHHWVPKIPFKNSVWLQMINSIKNKKNVFDENPFGKEETPFENDVKSKLIRFQNVNLHQSIEKWTQAYAPETYKKYVHIKYFPKESSKPKSSGGCSEADWISCTSLPSVLSLCLAMIYAGLLFIIGKLIVTMNGKNVLLSQNNHCKRVQKLSLTRF